MTDHEKIRRGAAALPAGRQALCPADRKPCRDGSVPRQGMPQVGGGVHGPADSGGGKAADGADAAA